MLKRGMTQSELARSVGISRQQAERYVNGRLRLSPEWAVRFARALGVKPEELSFFNDSEPQEPVVAVKSVDAVLRRADAPPALWNEAHEHAKGLVRGHRIAQAMTMGAVEGDPLIPIERAKARGQESRRLLKLKREKDAP
jgi:transcriptional regulator with XRE-family HTH domain